MGDTADSSDNPFYRAASEMWKAIKTDLKVDSQPVKNASDDKAGED